MTLAELTREQILAMPAGRELDALVAERLDLWTHPEPIEQTDGSDYWPVKYAPKFSTDIAAAWQVVEKFCPDGSRSVSIDRFHSDGLWHVEWGHRSYVDAETAPLAICKAALLATLEK